MKKRETIYICDHCGVIAREETEFSFGFYFKTLPTDWTQLGKEHLCPKCSEIYRKFKEEVCNEQQQKMEILPITFRQAYDFVAEHYHHCPTEGGIGCNFCLGFYDNDKLAGVAMICGRPVGIKPDNGFTCEVNRLCADGTYNAYARLCETCCRVIKEKGYKKIIIYILESEKNSQPLWVRETIRRNWNDR